MGIAGKTKTQKTTETVGPHGMSVPRFMQWPMTCTYGCSSKGIPAPCLNTNIVEIV